MAGGWAKDGAEQEQMDATINDALQRARRALPTGSSLEYCEECDAPIPEMRRQALPGVEYCVQCQSKLEAHVETQALFNRRGSKDSQLR